MAKVKVRLSIRPDEDWEVDEDEIPNLRAQGLLVEDAKPVVDEQAAEYEAARKRAAEERAAAASATPRTGRGQKDGE
jgi:hypothetical protein